MAFEQARHLVGRFDMPLGIRFQAQPRFVDRAFLADAGQHVLQGTAMRRVIEHATGSDEGNADARGEIGERCDAGAIVAAIRMPRREVEGSVEVWMPSGFLLRLELSVGRIPPPERGWAGVPT